MKYALSFLIHAFPDACGSPRPGWRRTWHAEHGILSPAQLTWTLLRIDSLGAQSGEEVPVVQAALSLIFFLINKFIS